MDTKAAAVKVRPRGKLSKTWIAFFQQIAEYAEYLSYHRTNESLFANSSYHFFNADNITDNDVDPEKQETVSGYIMEVRIVVERKAK